MPENPLRPRRVESPCVRNCCLDNESICMGCHRTMAEICGWHDASDAERLEILERCRVRSATRKSWPLSGKP
jgi:predicted Fe-S protein YdhL (DUF1289 family)